ncbi:16S rRNA (cytosine(1402)-N(4))-methyltransferase RsmH [bacterium]|jgi:16S rRNA (cytosine1402-N4)-methyltransferase|nr:16S rRNA (cytosine(1402)-N(4))-methyltransferase RsmH [bacterium]MBT4251154.1 16S rRNA (cytosine(1402)-N(4))-methyltransferase RsmH [bacterium]MBT4598054.1 16S rRNA (cytosine(1402)-N(4))-methyltransferase RsmH [bacterium]MBT6753397.1 16S rRNA (cytosine(1402)-N(4))-methyltransferase RsmH [bacterium]MBT7038110.1 16S rRNA (cytosine(1402)-N(4))-methyltransferase RsmH [bacterium]
MHKTVLLAESAFQLNLKKGDVVVDATLGMGGHTIELAKIVGEKGRVIAIDMDAVAIREAKNRIKKEHKEFLDRIIFVKDNFKNIDKIVAGQGTSAIKVKGVLADLGWRIEQINDPAYGLSFNVDARLNMRLDEAGDSPEDSEDAFDIINSWSADDLERLFRELGEERFSKRIVIAIKEARKEKEIKTTMELANIIEESVGHRGRKGERKIHPATKVFQALRIQVNSELNNLNVFLENALKVLEKDGRLAIISFHSIEDRIVKNFCKSGTKGCVCPKEFPICKCGKEPKLKLITKKPIIPSDLELKENRRARSAKLRVIQKK